MKVRITASEVVRYHQIVEMSEAEWLRLKSLDEHKAASFIEGYIDHLDVIPSNGIDPGDFEAVVVGEDGKALKPLDEYTGGID